MEQNAGIVRSQVVAFAFIFAGEAFRFVLGTHGGELVYESFERRQVPLQTWIVYVAPLVDVGASQAIILVVRKMICPLPASESVQ